MTGKLLKKLTSMKIPGVRGPLYLKRIKGCRDYKNSQVCRKDGHMTTPWIIERERNLAAYEQQVYTLVDKELAPIADKISVGIQELENLGNRVQLAADDTNPERRAAHEAARRAEQIRRMEEILVELAKTRSELEMIDSSLRHHLDKAEQETKKHVLAYWSGVLKSAASEDMPVEPEIHVTGESGRDIYLKHYANMMERISEALGGEEHEVA